MYLVDDHVRSAQEVGGERWIEQARFGARERGNTLTHKWRSKRRSEYPIRGLKTIDGKRRVLDECQGMEPSV